jgi:hypothetical protein
VNALALFQGKSNGVPAARRGLIDLLDVIDRRSDELETLKAGRRRLADQLELVDSAKRELEASIAQESRTLVDHVKHSVDWALSGFGGPRATKISESLAASRLQTQIGDKAASELDAEIAHLEVELGELRAEKPHHVKAVLVEVAAGYRSDLQGIADDLRQSLAILGGLDKLIAAPTGDFAPGRRLVVELPSVGGMAAQTIVAPDSAVTNAMGIWSEFSLELDADAMASVSSLDFPNVSGHEDDGRIVYAELSASERHRVDVLAAHTHHQAGVK